MNRFICSTFAPDLNSLNSMINQLSKIQALSVLFLFLLPITGFTQADQVTINGKKYFVYPHQEAVNSMQEYSMSFADSKEVIKRDDRNEKIVSVTVEPVTELEKKSALTFPRS